MWELYNGKFKGAKFNKVKLERWSMVKVDLLVCKKCCWGKVSVQSGYIGMGG